MFLWTVGIAFEPEYSKLRIELTKVALLCNVIDDVYDVYSTLDELELFTNAIERWDIKAVQILPDYIKICFLAVYNTVNNLVYETLKEHEAYFLPYLTNAWAGMCKAFLQEKKCCQNKQTPTFKYYLENGWISTSVMVAVVHTYFLMSQNIIKQGLESLEKCHNLLLWPSLIFQLCKDLTTSKVELERGETTNSILSIMTEFGFSEEPARRHISDLVQGTWKKMNKDVLVAGDSPFAKSFVEATMNLVPASR